MKSLLSILLLSAAIAGPAAAQEVRVSLADKDPATIASDIHRAAETVCYSAQKDGEVRPQEMARCISDVADDGMSQARAYESRRAPPTSAQVGDLASNGLAEASPSK